MCGIIGGCTQRDVVPLLLAGLQHLEYRGYDSAGIAVLGKTGLQRYRSPGKVSKLKSLLDAHPIEGVVGIAHTRWATHGEPNERNAHPHLSGTEIAIVHNGIIENYDVLRSRLIKLGYHFDSETDTETVAHLLHYELSQGLSFLHAVHEVIKQLEGAYALAFLYQKSDSIIAVRKGSPLVVGVGIGENFIASDVLALVPLTQQFIYLEEGDIVEITRQEVHVYDSHLQKVDRPLRHAKVNHETVSRGKYRHFMQKEIFEQPKAVLAAFENRIQDNRLNLSAFSKELLDALTKTKRIQIVACGTSYHAGLVARDWFESYVKIPTYVEVASEWRYRDTLVEPDTLFIVISQSGETADTLAALRLAKTRGYLATLSICNVAESSIVRETDATLLTFAGPEIGVASTKAFTTQLVNLFLLMVLLGRQQSRLTAAQEELFLANLSRLPAQIDYILDRSEEIEQLAKSLVTQQHALFLGRGVHYSIALEGALKLKELSYIHAEAYPAGELKHGPLALIDNKMPVIAIAPQDGLIEKLKSNLEEVKARGGNVLLLAHPAHKENFENNEHVFLMPEITPEISPMLYAIPLQLLAYHVAVLKGTDVDQPRNLAKSVTVE